MDSSFGGLQFPTLSNATSPSPMSNAASPSPMSNAASPSPMSNAASPFPIAIDVTSHLPSPICPRT